MLLDTYQCCLYFVTFCFRHLQVKYIWQLLQPQIHFLSCTKWIFWQLDVELIPLKLYSVIQWYLMSSFIIFVSFKDFFASENRITVPYLIFLDTSYLHFPLFFDDSFVFLDYQCVSSAERTDRWSKWDKKYDGWKLWRWWWWWWRGGYSCRCCSGKEGDYWVSSSALHFYISALEI